jgi:hypothetical protein
VLRANKDGDLRERERCGGGGDESGNGGITNRNRED